ncbi:hypothetical protein ZWY2020_052809 [Hordeum vulgare]|nr:hypothetical protein ZWY2020_052809 [Hordeum vulgare]
MVSRRILPLQRRPHLVCQMSGQYDPCRTSTKRFAASAVARGVNQISTAHMDDSGNWEWGLAPFEVDHLFEPAADSILQMFEKLHALNPRAPDEVTCDTSEIEDEGMIEPRSTASEGSENALESEGTEPSGDHLKPSIVDWTDDDETPPSLSNAAFEEDSDGVEEVTSPPLTRVRRHKAEATWRKGKGATASRPAPKRAATGPPAEARAGGAKKRRAGAGRRQVPIVAGEAEDVEEDTASAIERAGWAAADAAQKELEEQSARRWDAAAEKMAEGQSRPSQAKKPVERHTKARHDPSMRVRVEEPASEAAPRRARRTEVAKPSEPDASVPVDLEEIPESREAEVVANAPKLNLDVPDVAVDATEVIMDVSDATNRPHAVDTAPTGLSAEPVATPTSGDGTIVISNRGPTAPGAGPRAGSRPMKALRAANLEHQTLPAGTLLQGVPELVSLFASNRYKVEQEARVAGSDLERLEERTRVSASSLSRISIFSSSS